MSQDEEALLDRYWDLHSESFDYWSSDPDRVVGMLEEAIHIATQLQHPHKIMETRHWLQQIIVFQKRDYERGLAMCIESVVEARKPIYQGWRTRICLYQDLIAAYTGSDAVSYEKQIEAALDKMQAEAPQYSQCASCLIGERTSFEMRRANYDAAKVSANAYLSKTSDPYHRANAHIYLAQLAVVAADWQAATGHSKKALELAKHSRQQDGIVILGYLHQAMAHRQLGNEHDAQHCFEQSEVLRQDFHATLYASYWDARVAYFEMIADAAAAVDARQEHIAAIGNKGALREEAEAYLDLCRLEKQNGEISPSNAQACGIAIAKLKNGADLRLKLNELTKS